MNGKGRPHTIEANHLGEMQNEHRVHLVQAVIASSELLILVTAAPPTRQGEKRAIINDRLTYNQLPRTGAPQEQRRYTHQTRARGSQLLFSPSNISS